jgi:hypothetical protein
MEHLKVKIVSTLMLLMMIISCSWASEWDLNPGQVGVKHKHDMTSDVQGEGYVVEYMKVNTNNLSMLEYAHGSGTMDYADILYDEQKSVISSESYYWMISSSTFEWVKKLKNGQSMITYSKQYDNIQSPSSFAYGTGWYASHPVTYNSLLKDKNEAKSYQESASMHRQIEYARAIKGDISVEMNCTGPTATADGKGLLQMKIDDDIVQGTLHVGELMTMPMKTTTVPKYSGKLGWKSPVIEIDANYVGDFQVQKTMKLDFTKSKSTWGEDWLPCCSGSFFDIPSWNFDKEYSGRIGIFDCTCREAYASSMKPAWNTTQAQFPTAEYQYKA